MFTPPNGFLYQWAGHPTETVFNQEIPIQTVMLVMSMGGSLPLQNANVTFRLRRWVSWLLMSAHVLTLSLSPHLK